MSKPLIIVMGANPAWQKTLLMPGFSAGKVNRAIEEKNYSAGKGVNFCRALRCSGLADMMLFQFAGGINGERLCDDLEAEHIPHNTIITQGETRCCITCLDGTGNMTELIGVSQKLTDAEITEFLDKLSKTMPSASLFAITGSLPDGSDYDLYRKAALLASSLDIPILIDVLRGVQGVLTLPGKVILKVNQEEFLKITDCDNIEIAHKTAWKKFPGKMFAVTNGKDPASFSDGTNIYYYKLPEIDVVSPLGAGDTASAVMSALIASGEPAENAFRQALAAASANCLNAVAGEYSPIQSRLLSQQITVSLKNIF